MLTVVTFLCAHPSAAEVCIKPDASAKFTHAEDQRARVRDKTSPSVINNLCLVSLEGALDNGSEGGSKPLSAKKECSLLVIRGGK